METTQEKNKSLLLEGFDLLFNQRNYEEAKRYWSPNYTLASLPKWNNQILIDGTNPFHGKAGDFTPADVGNLSTSQLVAALAPGARVVKAFNHMIVPNLEAEPVVNGARRVAFVSADDDDAKKRVETLLETFGYSVIDLGNLRDGGLIQQAGGPLAGRDLLERGES